MDRSAFARIRTERDRMGAGLAVRGFSTAPYQTNFLSVDVGRASTDAAAALLVQGIIVKPWWEHG
jgi:histidinol-phosphate aminotransferase